MSETMIERVAKAICGNNRTYKDWEGEARAAIAAMREPTWPMEQAGILGSDSTREKWHLMIDKALEE